MGRFPKAKKIDIVRHQKLSVHNGAICTRIFMGFLRIFFKPLP
jgi:hypothetical protein